MLLGSGCHGPDQDHASHDDVSFGGRFVEVADPEVTLTVQNGRFRQGGQDIFSSGAYHAHRINDTTYELHVDYDGKFEGIGETMIFRKDGEHFFIKSTDDEEETRFKRAE
jgi:hypothetical protein